MTEKKKKDLKEMTLVELREEALSLIALSQSSYKNAKFKQMLEANKALEEVIDQYAITKRDEVFCALKNTKDPMLEAIKQLRYNVIAVKEEKIEGTKEKEKVITERERAIDLLELDKYCGGTLGKNPEWNAALKFFGACLIARNGSDCEQVVDVKTTKAFTGISAEVKEKVLNGRTPEEACSNEGLVETLNHLIELIIGKKYAKVTNTFAQFLLKVSVKKGRGVAELSAISHRVMTEVLAEVMHCIVLGKTITISHKYK